MTIAQAIHRSRSLLGVLLVLAAAARLSAQEAPVADPKDVASVDAIMASVYDVISGRAGEERDWDRMRSLFLPEARLIPSFVNPAGEIGICGFTDVAASIAEHLGIPAQGPGRSFL